MEESTLEFSDDDDISEIECFEDGNPKKHRKIFDETSVVVGDMKAELRFVSLTQFVGEDAVESLSHLSRNIARIITGFEQALLSQTTVVSLSQLKCHDNNTKISAEEIGMFLVEASTFVAKASNELSRLVTRLMLANFLREKSVDPISNWFTFRDGHFHVEFREYERLI
jgi:hypothetical protein